jgi:hypothetical protein
MKLLLIACSVVLLAGCATETAQPPPSRNPCEAANRILANQYATPGQQLAAVEYAKMHCYGPQPVQRVQIVR